MDLLSVLSHELGHVLGLDHDDAGVMAETLAVGKRATALNEDQKLPETYVATNGLLTAKERADAGFDWWLPPELNAVPALVAVAAAPASATEAPLDRTIARSEPAAALDDRTSLAGEQPKWLLDKRDTESLDAFFTLLADEEKYCWWV